MDGLHTRFIRMARELYRRRVPRVVAAYTITGVAAINLADLLTAIFELSDYTERLVLVLLLVGFPVAVGLSWALDITSHGIVRTPTEPDRRPRVVTTSVRRRRIMATAGTVAVLLLVGLTLWRFTRGDEKWRPESMVAVIPAGQGTTPDEAVTGALATLLGTRLESAGWSTVDSDTMSATLGLPLAPGRVAASVGAGYYVDLQFVIDEDTVALNANLFRVDNPGDTLRSAQAHGPFPDAVSLVDALAAELTGFEYGLLNPFPSDPGAGRRVAILPVEIAGSPGDEYLKEAIATLLAARLEQAGWPASDSRSLFGAVEQYDASSTRNASRLAAEKVYAAFYVETRVELQDSAGAGESWLPWRKPPEVRAESRLYQVDNDRTPVATVTAEGGLDEITRIVARLAGALAGEMYIGDRAAPLADDAPTSSITALEAFIEGDTLFRSGNYRESAAAFERAVDADRLFSLAYYRLSIAAEWAGDVGGYTPWREQGVRLAILSDRCERIESAGAGAGPARCEASRSRRLTWRTRLLAEARHSQQRGDIGAAERLYEWVLEAFPDDYEATFQLAEILFHNAPLEGRDALASDSLWQRVLVFKPTDFGAMLHSARLDALDGRLAELRTVAATALESEPEGERRLEMEAYLAFSGAAPDMIEDVTAALARLEEPRSIWSIGGRVALFTRNLAGATRVIRLLTDSTRSREARLLGHVTLAHLLAAQGKRREGRRELQMAQAIDPLAGLVFDVSLLLAPFAPDPPRAELEAMKRQLLINAPRPPGEDPVTELTVHDSVYDRLRLYALGILSLKLGAESEANRYINELAALPGSDDALTLGDELARSLRTESAMAKGNLMLAEQESEGLHIRTAANKLILSPFFALTRERFLRGEILTARGREDEALQQFSSFDAVSVYDLAYLAPAHAERAQLLEERGDGAAAALEYRRVVELWPDPDPELMPLIQRARDRMDLSGPGN